MTIKYNGKNLIKRIINGQEVEKVMYNWVQIRPDVVPPTVDYLCFTANTAGSTVKFSWDASYSIAAPNLQYSYDKTTWIDYQYWSYAQWETITLNNVWDKIYFRNKAETPTALCTYYHTQNFVLTGSISASWDVWFMLCRYSTNVIPDYWLKYLFVNCTALTTAPRLPATQVWTRGYAEMFSGCSWLTTTPELPATTLSYYCYFKMFSSCTSLTTVPSLPALTLADGCYYEMFRWCTSIISLPELPATNLTVACYMGMFNECTSIKLSDTQWWEYQTPYIIPIWWGWTDDTNSLYDMFLNTWWSWTWTPIINTTYYTSNTII